MRKKILCLVMAVLMTAGTQMTAYAEEIKGSNDWLVDFDGEKMNTNFDPSDMSAEAYKLLPGDSMEWKISIQNSAEDETDWYMTNEILQSLEESNSAAEGGAYAYRLSYVGADQQETVLYSSDTVGGEGSTAAGEGLEQATNAMDEYFYLDRLAKGDSGSVYLEVTLDGETQGNGYQNTLARMQMNFAAEKVTAKVEYKTGEPTVVDKVVKTNIKTGDETKILGACALALVSGLILLVAAIVTIKKKRRNKKGERRS